MEDARAVANDLDSLASYAGKAWDACRPAWLGQHRLGHYWLGHYSATSFTSMFPRVAPSRGRPGGRRASGPASSTRDAIDVTVQLDAEPVLGGVGWRG